MKIAYILSTCENSGPFIVAKDIINNIVTDVEITIYYLKESESKLNFNAPCVKVNILKKTDFSSYDIVHSHGFIADFYSYKNRKSIKKRVTTIHQEIKAQYSLNYNRVIGSLIEKVWLKFIQDADYVVTLSKIMTDYYQSRLKNTKIKFIYNGISPIIQQLNDNYNIEDISFLKQHYKLIGVSASLTYRKGIDQIIRALAIDKNQLFALLIIGNGNKKYDLIKLSKELNVDNRVLFLGYKTNAFSYFQYFDIYVMSSRLEAFGLCVIEAASQKLPVVCSDLPIFNELFNSDEIIKYTLNDIPSLLKSIIKADENKQQLSQNIFKSYNKHYTDKIMANNYLKLYIALI